MAKKPFWKYFSKDDEEEIDDFWDDDSGSEGDSGSDSGEGGGAGRIAPKEGEGFTSYLIEETEQMAYERRGLEQYVEKQMAGVEERKKPQRQQGETPGGTEQKLRQHPLLDSQRFDGIDPGINPAPFGIQEAEIAFENERREQEMEKQLRLGNMPKMGKAPELRMQ